LGGERNQVRSENATAYRMQKGVGGAMGLTHSRVQRERDRDRGTKVDDGFQYPPGGMGLDKEGETIMRAGNGSA